MFASVTLTLHNSEMYGDDGSLPARSNRYNGYGEDEEYGEENYEDYGEHEDHSADDYGDDYGDSDPEHEDLY